VVSLAFVAQAGRDHLRGDLGSAADPRRPLPPIDTDVDSAALLTGTLVDVSTALAWGRIDAVD
jgi:hypothetical protein